MEIITKNIKWVARILLVLIIILGIRWYINRDGIKPVAVRKINIEQREVVKTVSASGDVKSKSEVDLSFNSAGRINEIAVMKGDYVEEGQYLASLNTLSTSASIQALKDARDIAIRERDLFVENYESKKSAYGGKDEYDIRLRQLNEYISQAEANYNAGIYGSSNSYIYSPISGTVVDVYKEVGETSVIGEKVVKIVNLNEIVFEIVLDQEDFGIVSSGMDVIVNLDSYDNIDFNGKITELPFYANGGTSNNFTVEITLETKDNIVPLIGMSGDAHIEIEKSAGKVDSLIYDQIFYDENDDPYLWIIENGYLKKIQIKTGLEGDIYTEIITKIDNEIVVPVDDTTDIDEGYRPKITG